MSDPAAIQELVSVFAAINATRYLTIAGLVVLLYDHLLLFQAEVRHVWAAQHSWLKSLFLINRYGVPACIIIDVYTVSEFSSGLSPEFCKVWLLTSTLLGVTSLAIANIFVVRRVWALWARNTTIKKVLMGAFICAYIATYTATVITYYQMIPNLGYSSVLKTCTLSAKPNVLVVVYAAPISLDVLIFTLTWWNAFDRPRHKQTVLVKQLATDGAFYFVCLLSLRLFNIIVTSAANISYSQLGVYFLWSMITVLVNRMLITNGIVEVHPGPDPTGREMPFKSPHRAIFSDYDHLNCDDYDDDIYYGNKTPGVGADAGARYGDRAGHPTTTIVLDIGRVTGVSSTYREV